MAAGVKIGGDLEGRVGVFRCSTPNEFAAVAPGFQLAGVVRDYRAICLFSKNKINVYYQPPPSPPLVADGGGNVRSDEELHAAVAEALHAHPEWRSRFVPALPVVRPAPTPMRVTGFDPVTKIAAIGLQRFAMYARWLTALSPRDAVDVAHRMAVVYKPALRPAPLASRAVWEELLGRGVVPDTASPVYTPPDGDGAAQFALSQVLEDEAELEAVLESGWLCGTECMRSAFWPADYADDARFHSMRRELADDPLARTAPQVLAALERLFLTPPSDDVEAESVANDPRTTFAVRGGGATAAIHMALSGVPVAPLPKTKEEEDDAAQRATRWANATRVWAQ